MEAERARRAASLQSIASNLDASAAPLLLAHFGAVLLHKELAAVATQLIEGGFPVAVSRLLTAITLSNERRCVRVEHALQDAFVTVSFYDAPIPLSATRAERWAPKGDLASIQADANGHAKAIAAHLIRA